MTVSLADLTTLRVGGPADSFVEARTDDELINAVTNADDSGRPVLLVGGGSNLLVADSGFPGLVVRVATRSVQMRKPDHREDPDDGRDPEVLVTVAAGEVWDEFVAHCVSNDWSGIEALSGIPGSVGATPIQNVGAYGGEVAESIAAMRAFDRVDGRICSLVAEDAGFGYRTSVFKRKPGRWLVLDVTYRLGVSGRSAPIRYAELATRLGVSPGDRAPLEQVRDAVLGLRRSKGMVADPSDHDTWSAGSFFTNPFVTPAQAAALPERAPRFPQPDGRVKTSAAWLIANAGFGKGFAISPESRATLSTKHTLALTNRGGASTEDILELARVVRAGVADRFGIILENEPVAVGCSL